VAKVMPIDSKKDGDEDSCRTIPGRGAQDAVGGENGKALSWPSFAVASSQAIGCLEHAGAAELENGHREEALGAFEKAVELNPRTGYAHTTLGWR